MNLDLIILKTLITNKKHALDFANEYDASLFSPETWTIANILLNHVKTYKDLPTLRVITERFPKNNEKTVENLKKAWTQIENTQYDDKEYKYDLERLKKRFAEKQINAIKDKLDSMDPGAIDVNRTISDLQKTVQSIKSLNHTKAYERKTLRDAVPMFRDEYNAKLNDPTFDRGIMTGYSYLDNVTDGFRSGELILVGGESGGGKSMLLMNMAVQLWMQGNNIYTEEEFKPGNNVLYFSLEMPFKPCLNRVLARMSGAPSKLIRNAKLNPNDAMKLKKSLKFVTKYPNQFEIIDIPRGATIENLELLYEDAKAHYDPKIVVIDYLGLMDYEGTDMDDWLKLGKIAEKIHEFARVHNLIVLSAVQLNRSKGGKEIEDKIGLHRIGRSALIMQNANIAIQIETRQNEKQYPDMYYHLIKNRDGELGRGKLIKNLACGTLLDDRIEGEEDDTEFFDRDPDDISDRLDMLDDI